MQMWSVDPEEIARHQALHDSVRHDIRRLFDELSLEQLNTLETILNIVIGSESGDVLASQMLGRVAMLRELKFKVCSACGRNHDEDLKDLTKDSCPDCGSTDPKMHPATQPGVELIALCSNEFHGSEVPYTQLGWTGPMQPHEIETMAEYGIDDLRDPDTNELVGFICLNCDKRYESIEERKRRKPKDDGCDGCHKKAAWG